MPPDGARHEPAGPGGAVRLDRVSHAWPASRGGASRQTLDGIDLAVDPGSVVALVGPSGCGKSTLLRIVAGLTVPTAGVVEVDGVDVAGRPGGAAWMPQHHNLLPWRRVLGNAVLGAEIGGVPRADAEARARPLLERFGLGGFERHWPAQLSGGMRQRLAVLRTVLIDAPVLLLDEPFGALDALTRRSMHGWFQEVLAAGAPGGERGGRTVVLVTHDVEEALVLADRVVVLSARPATVVADVAVPFAWPRRGDLVADPRFVAMRASLLEALGV
jgi:ABC-type nitrate/sulfonate/bicarbonate transport system ATPase subunit